MTTQDPSSATRRLRGYWQQKRREAGDKEKGAKAEVIRGLS